MGRVTVAGGKPAMEAPSGGILASDIAAGSTVKLMENGVAVDYLVVNNGIPSDSSLYDSSCDGLWLLRKEVLSARQWDSSNTKYAESSINEWLNGDFFNQFGSAEQSAIKQVKIPYCIGGGSTTVNSGASGLSTKVFLLGLSEVGYYMGSSGYPDDGATIPYFANVYDGVYDALIAYRNGAAMPWWLRTPVVGSVYEILAVHLNGYCSNTHYTSTVMGGADLGPRPALILPKTALFDESTMLFKGVA